MKLVANSAFLIYILLFLQKDLMFLFCYMISSSSVSAVGTVEHVNVQH